MVKDTQTSAAPGDEEQNGRDASHFRLRRERDQARKKLDKLLSRANDEHFLRMIWAADAVQAGGDRARGGWAWFSTRPQNLVEQLAERPFFQKWMLETLANQLLLVSKARTRENGPNKILDCRHLSAAVDAMNLLHKLENAEDGLILRRISVLTQMHRLGQRQFPWQRNMVNKGVFYKTSFLYAFPEAQQRFLERHAISYEDFALVGFALYTLLQTHSACRLPLDLNTLGISKATTDKALSLLSSTIGPARTEAKRHRAASTHIAYTASVFRSTPLIRFPEVIVAPIPDLIVGRVTDGIYYDIITGSDGTTNKDVASKIGKRFEEYCRELLEGYLQNLKIRPEFQYKSQHSPDLLVLKDSKMVAAVECKAKRQPITTKFSEEQEALKSAGLDEIAKGVFQLWRFFSHVRRGIAVGAPAMDTSAIGVLLTLDTWLEASEGQRDEVLKRAHALADDKGNEITNLDRRPIVFCHVDDLEYLLARASDEDVMRTLRIASTPERQGWMLSGLFESLPDKVPVRKADPFADRFSEVASWLTRIEAPATNG